MIRKLAIKLHDFIADHDTKMPGCAIGLMISLRDRYDI